MGVYRHELNILPYACGLDKKRTRYLISTTMRLEREAQKNSSLVEAFENEPSLTLREKLIGIFQCGRNQGGAEAWQTIINEREILMEPEEDQGESWKHDDDGDEWKKIVSRRRRF